MEGGIHSNRSTPDYPHRGRDSQQTMMMIPTDDDDTNRRPDSFVQQKPLELARALLPLGPAPAISNKLHPSRDPRVLFQLRLGNRSKSARSCRALSQGSGAPERVAFSFIFLFHLRGTRPGRKRRRSSFRSPCPLQQVRTEGYQAIHTLK